jgi:hypothetical protein
MGYEPIFQPFFCCRQCVHHPDPVLQESRLIVDFFQVSTNSLVRGTCPLTWSWGCTVVLQSGQDSHRQCVHHPDPVQKESPPTHFHVRFVTVHTQSQWRSWGPGHYYQPWCSLLFTKLLPSLQCSSSSFTFLAMLQFQIYLPCNATVPVLPSLQCCSSGLPSWQCSTLSPTLHGQTQSSADLVNNFDQEVTI